MSYAASATPKWQPLRERLVRGPVVAAVLVAGDSIGSACSISIVLARLQVKN